MIRCKSYLLGFSSLLCAHIMGAPIEAMRSPALLFPWSEPRIVAGTGDSVSNALVVVDYSTQAGLEAFCCAYIEEKYPESGHSPSEDEISMNGRLIRKYLVYVPDTNAVVSAGDRDVLREKVFFDVTECASKPETGAWVLLKDSKQFKFGSMPFWSDDSSYDDMWRNFPEANGFVICQLEPNGPLGCIEFGQIVNGLRHGEWTTIHYDETTYRSYDKYDMGKDVSSSWSPDFSGETILSLEWKAPTCGMHLSWLSTSFGIFNEEESPRAVWVLRNDTSLPFVITGVLSPWGDLTLEFCGADGQWVSIGDNNEKQPYRISPGEDGRIRVTLKPFSRTGNFFNVVHLIVEGYDELLPLTVDGEARRLVESNPAFPMKLSNYPDRSVSRIEAKLMPRESGVAIGTPYVTNAIVPTVITLNTNALPWALEISMNVADDYIGPVGCDVVLPVISPSNHVNQKYVYFAKSGNYAAVQKRSSAITVDWFTPYDLELLCTLEREIFLKLDLDPGYRVVRHRLGNPEQMQLLQAQIKAFGSNPDQFHVAVVKGELLEGETAIRNKFIPIVQTGDWLSAGRAACEASLRDEEANPIKPGENVADGW